MCAKHDRGQPDDGRPHAAAGQPDHEVLGLDPRAAGREIGLGARPAGDAREGEHERAGGGDERLARPVEHRGKRLDGGEVGRGRAGVVARPHQVVLEGEVDDAVGRSGGLAQPVEIVQVAAPDLSAGGLERPGRAVGARQPHDLMPGLQQLGHDGRADVPGCAGHENARGKSSRNE
jgi:hypothetical protein